MTQEELDSLSNDIQESQLQTQLELIAVSSSLAKDFDAELKTLEALILAKFLSGLFSNKKAFVSNVNEAKKQIESTYSKQSETMTKAASTVAKVIHKSVADEVKKKDEGLAKELLKAVSDKKNDFLVMDNKSEAWWKRLGSDLAFKAESLANAIRANAMEASQIRGELGSLFDNGRKNASPIIRSSLMTAANRARLDAYKATSSIVQGVKQISTLDSKTTEICRTYAGAEWDLDGNPINGNKLPFESGPPRHWNCRSILIPIVFGANNDSGSGSISFARWLDSQSKDFQDATVGYGRAQLWRDGKLTLPQLLDGSGARMSLEKFEKRHS